MKTLTQPLRDEYEGLHGQVEIIRSVADTIDGVPLESLQRGVDAVLRFLQQEVSPLVCAEDQAQYPVVERLLGGSGATAPMAKQCADLRRLADDLGSLRLRLVSAEAAAREANEVRRVLYGLYELLKVHLLTEEDVYLPLLERQLSPEAARQVVMAMADAEARTMRR